MNQDISKQNISRFSEITLDDEVIDSMQNEKELPSQSELAADSVFINMPPRVAQKVTSINEDMNYIYPNCQ